MTSPRWPDTARSSSAAAEPPLVAAGLRGDYLIGEKAAGSRILFS
jgi:hypothetical protein